MGKQGEMASLENPNQKLKATCTMKKKKSEQTKCSNKCPNYGKLLDQIIKREAHHDSNMTKAQGDANKGTSKRLTAKWMWNWPETFVVHDGWQDCHSETFLVDTTQGLEDEIDLVMSKHLIVQTEENLNHTRIEATNELGSLAFTSSKQIWKNLDWYILF